MGVADLFVKPHPWNFVKCFIFYICLNVITIVFWISKSFQIYKFLNPTSYPVLELSLKYQTNPYRNTLDQTDHVIASFWN